LTRKQFITDKKVPYYLNWISRFHESCKTNDLTDYNKSAIDKFLSDLEKTCEEWQVLQAKEAIRLFLYYETIKDKEPLNDTRPTTYQEWKRNFSASLTSN